MDKRLLPVIILSFLWAGIFNLCKKATILESNLYNLALIKILFLGIIGIILLVLFSKDNKLKDFRNIKSEVYNIIFITSLFQAISMFLYFYSLKNNDVSWSVPMIEASVILVSSLVSIYYFKEKLTPIRIIGILTILLGIYLVNLS